ncbi:MAG: hypothetical protein QN174_00675 [Armatimonadota bacterium]|nr:hypothetical protein [Armatimonadota bacterium]MDR7422103.1 hypothetical protein [Armatimonadota bacterium]MDR7454829.1 hypothetical protein [Armatimonadota bacterium]MDR7457880.1 hypothetical protein [Armatimonadota bacterium]MDR7495461.1 hypothetical protein [Armatimonadota bacterium]
MPVVTVVGERFSALRGSTADHEVQVVWIALYYPRVGDREDEP